MRARILLLIAASMLCVSLHAQETLPPFCTSALIDGPGGEAGHLTFDPASPSSSHPVTITAGRTRFIPQQISAHPHGRTVDVYLTGYVDYLTTPRGDSCLSIGVGPLAAGAYTVNVYSIDPFEAPNDPPLLILSNPLTVAGGVAVPITAPTLSWQGLTALFALLAVGAFIVLGRKRAGR